jgi:hypothetical protein
MLAWLSAVHNDPQATWYLVMPLCLMIASHAADERRGSVWRVHNKNNKAGKQFIILFACFDIARVDFYFFENFFFV